MKREQKTGTFAPHPIASGALPPLVQQCRDLCLTATSGLLADMFASCDDLFFDLSSRASTNREQNLYFESMREVRLRKADVMAAFNRELGSMFEAVAQPAEAVTREAAADSPELSLVAHDKLEQTVAIASMVSRARSESHEALYHLKCRLDHLLPVTVTERNNPLDPAQIANAFATACAPLELEIKPRIVLFKQFERKVINGLEPMYQTINQHLANAGVLARIPGQVTGRPTPVAGGRASGGTTPAPQPAPATLSVAEDGSLTVSFGDLTQLLNALRDANRPLPVSAHIPAGTFTGPAMAPGELEALLAEAQLEAPAAGADAAQHVDIRSALQYIASKQQQANSPRSLQPLDENIINLVSMFFDFVMQDAELAVPVQALLGRLQLPILRLALHDRSFFNNASHPARRLINEIAQCGIGWNEQDKAAQDQLYLQLSAQVQKIHDEFDGTQAVFERALETLGQQLEQERRKSSLVELRTSEAAAGQARAEAARLTVSRLVRERLAGQQVADVALTLLQGDWQRVMFLTLLRHGEDSPEWLQCVQMVDDLLWSTRQHNDERSVERLQAMIPRLRERLLQGMEVAGIEQEKIDAALNGLGEVHRHLLSGQTEKVSSQRFQPDQEDTAEYAGGKRWSEMTALERQQIQYRTLTYNFIKQAEALAVGTWMSFEDARSHVVTRCKLAARIPESDSFVFVNRFGFKVMQKGRKELAYDLQTGRAKVLDASPLFERTLHKLMQNLRSALDAPSPA